MKLRIHYKSAGLQYKLSWHCYVEEILQEGIEFFSLHFMAYIFGQVKY